MVTVGRARHEEWAVLSLAVNSGLGLPPEASEGSKENLEQTRTIGSMRETFLGDTIHHNIDRLSNRDYKSCSVETNK